MKSPCYCKTFVNFYHITRCHNQGDVSLIANTLTLLTKAIILKVVTVGFCSTTAPRGPRPPDLEVLQSHSDIPHSVGCLGTSDQFVAETSTWKNIHHSQQTNFHALGDIRTRNRSKRAAADPRQRPRGNLCGKVECNVVPVNNMKSLNMTSNVAWHITSAVDGSDCSTSSPGRFTPCEKSPGTNWVEYWSRSRAGLRVFGKRFGSKYIMLDATVSYTKCGVATILVPF